MFAFSHLTKHWRKTLTRLGVLILFALIILSHYYKDLSAANPEMRVVQKGESASYIALRYYGFFSDSLFAALRQANRHLAELNLLQVGDTLFLPPRQAANPTPELLRTQAASAVLTLSEGEVRYRSGTGAFKPATVNLILKPNDEITTGTDGRAELVLDNRSVMRLAANSQLKIIALRRATTSTANNAYQASFSLSVGSIWTRVTLFLDKPPKIEVKLPTAIAGVQGTIYRATVAADSTTRVRVYEGTVSVRANPLGNAPQRIGPPQQIPGPRQITVEEWIKMVRAYHELVIAKNGKPSEPRPFTDEGADLAWARWNQARDRDLSAEQ